MVVKGIGFCVYGVIIECRGSVAHHLSGRYIFGGYIGSTSRNLKIRISEHRGLSYRTNKQLLKPSFSTISLESIRCTGIIFTRKRILEFYIGLELPMNLGLQNPFLFININLS